MDSKFWKWLAAIALIAFLAVTGNARVTVGGTDAQTGQPVVTEVPAASAGEEQVGQVVDGLLSTVPQLLATAAVGGFVAAVLNLGKLFPGAAAKLDGKTGTITIVVNVIAFIAITVSGYFGYADRVKSILEQTGNAIPAAIGLITTLGGVLTALGGSSLVHNIMKKINPAFSFTERIWQDMAKSVGTVKFADADGSSWGPTEVSPPPLGG